MAYNPNVPAQANQVRGASGDLVKMRENFQLLDPVATSGISGLAGVSLTSPASGDVLRFNGSNWVDGRSALNDLSDVNTAGVASGNALVYDGSGWVDGLLSQTLSGLTDTTITAPVSGAVLTYDGGAWIDGAAPAQTLSGLTDTTITSPTSGQALIYNGSAWVNSGSVPRAYASCYKTANQDITADGNFYVISGFTEVENINSGFTLTSSGFQVTDSTISRVNVQAEADFSTAANQRAGMKITLNGASLETTSYGIEAHSESLAGSAGTPSIEVTAMNVPVTSGDVIGFSAAINGGATHLVLSGTGTSIAIADAAQAPGGGGHQVPATRAIFSLASGATQSISNNTDTQVANIQLRQANGTIAYNATTGSVEVPSGITHARLKACVKWDANGTNDRRMWFLFGSDARPKGNAEPRIGCFSIMAGNGATNDIQEVSTPWIPVTPGTAIKLYVRQGSGGALNISAGYAVGGTGPVHQTYWALEFSNG